MATNPDFPQAQSRTQADMSAALALHAEGGDAADKAGGLLFRLLWPVYRRKFMRWGMREAVAEEVASEAILKILDGLCGMRDRIAFLKWSNTVARRTFLDQVRSMQAANDHEVYADDEGWTSIWGDLEDPSQLEPCDRLCLQRQLDAFCKAHPDRAMVLEQIVLEGWSVEESARALCRTGAGAKEYLSQCRKRLMSFLRVCFVGDGA